MIDPKDIKAGAQIAVTVVRDGLDEGGDLWIKRGDKKTFLHLEDVNPLPSLPPSSTIDAEIAEIVGAWMDDVFARGVLPPYFEREKVKDLVMRRRALLRPEDSVAQLLEACQRHEDLMVQFVQAGEQPGWEGRRAALLVEIEAAKQIREEAAERVRKERDE